MPSTGAEHSGSRSASHNGELHVAVAVISSQRGEILISKRPPRVHQGGLWEFPGGKVEPGESVLDSLVRELEEELAILVSDASPLIKIRHAYADRRVLLDVWRVRAYRGTPRGAEGQAIAWVRADELPAFAFPDADARIIAAVRLPEFYAILNQDSDDRSDPEEKLEGLTRLGIRLIQLRAKALCRDRYLELAERICELAVRQDVAVLLNAPPALVRRAGAAGVHLSSSRLTALRTRPLDREYWVSASCHNLAELRHAEGVGVDFAVLSPVCATPGHPAAEPLGWRRFESLVSAVNIPVYALGGLGRDALTQALSRGAQGIAGIRGFLGAAR